MARANQSERIRDIDRAFLDRYDLVGPRYTSYPTAPEWSEAVDARAFERHLAETKKDWQGRPLSIYLHIPFCEEHCTFCACNVIISPKGREVSEPYLTKLEREIELHAALSDPNRPVVQFHWGGGTPTYLDAEQLEQTHEAVASRFRFAAGCEKSIEIHVSVTSDEQLRTLARLGFNRISMGVQDFNERTQAAINRHQSYERTRDITELSRSLGFRGINYDLVYGLPYQTETTFGETLDRVFELRPDRLALYNFAFLPERLAHQRVIDPATLPDAETKFRIFLEAYDRFREEGYEYIGMDHFALPDDELARAFADGSLHRNFMGYTTQAGSDLIGMGVSSISSVGNMYAQNVKKLTRYSAALDEGRLPTERGFVLNEDDLIRRRVIQDLMCRRTLCKSDYRDSFGIDFDDYFAEELHALDPLMRDELLANTSDALDLTFLGRLLNRNIAMIFDTYFQAKQREGRKQLFSRTL
jgi:oxygen-independent coproporphyrinogen III oxidase